MLERPRLGGGTRVLRLGVRTLRGRLGRVAAIFFAVLIAATGFTTLTASSRASQLAVTGTVNERGRLAFDILVRPRGARTAVEDSGSLVQGGYLSGVAGGISLGQWHAIEQIPGIAVAAPIALLGYVVPTVHVPIDLSGVAPSRGDSVTRLDTTWRYDNGLSTVRSVPDFAFQTDEGLWPTEGGQFDSHYGGPDSSTLIGPEGSQVDERGLTETTRPPAMSFCSSTHNAFNIDTCVEHEGRVDPAIRVTFPVLLVAVDPDTEARLTGLGTRLTSGSGLTGVSLKSADTATGTFTPVLAAAEPSTQVQAQVRLSRVGGGAVRKVLHGHGASAMLKLPYSSVKTVTVTSSDAYRLLLQQLRHLPGDPNTSRFATSAMPQRFTIGTPQYHQEGRTLVPTTVPNQLGVNILDKGFSTSVPASMDDVAVRTAASVHGPQARGIPQPATIKVVGTLPSDAAAKLTDTTSQILSGLQPAQALGADPRSQRLLGHTALAPSPNVAGLVQPAPLMITTLSAVPQWYDGWTSTAGATSPPSEPISAVRVKVQGVTGVDSVSRARVRLAAQRIHQETGLDVDIALGASATQVNLVNPAGKNGRPQLLLVQQWVKKGVATVILKALDRKSLAIFCLVLLVCALTVANAVIADVRARRTELGVLACLGWSPREIVALVLGEVVVVAGLAGCIGAGLSLVLGHLASTPVGVGRALLAIPAALVVALVAGLGPVWRAGRAQPMAAIRESVSVPRRAPRVRSISAFARVNLTRNTGRTVLGTSGLAVAVGASTFLVVITLGFKGAVVGSVLGDAVAVQVRAADVAAVGATLLLALLGVANVIYLNIRERGHELATLSALGWTSSNLNRAMLGEALGLGLAGTLAGVALGLLASSFFLAGVSTSAMVTTAVTCTGIGLLVTLLAAAASGHLVRRLPLADLLTEE